MKKINKKAEEGDLLKETLGIILFVVGAAILVFAVWKIWDLAASQERKNAEKIVDDIARKAAEIEEGENIGFTVIGLPEWYLAGWSKNEPTDKKPTACFFSSCICICKVEGIFGISERDCKSNGICRDIKFEEVFVGGFVNYKNELLTIEKFFEDPTLYNIVYSIVQRNYLINERYWIGKDLYFLKDEPLIKIVSGINNGKLYIIKWDNEGTIPPIEKSINIDLKK